MEELEELYDELRKLPVPSGFARLAEDLDTTVYLYGDTMIGSANSFLAGKKVDPMNITVDMDLDSRLETCIQKAEELLRYKRKIDQLAETLASTVSRSKDS